MTHRLGRVVPDGRTVTDTSGIDLTPGAGPHGPVRFVILNFDTVSLSAGAQLRVDLGYGTDVFTVNSGSTFWTRPVDTATLPVKIRIVGGTGTAVLRRYGSGEPDIPPGQTPGTSIGSLTNPDVFLHSSPYIEPTYETRLECTPGFAWRNAACPLPTITDTVRQRVAAATGIIVEVDSDHVSSCSGTLIGADLFLTARHCLTDANHADLLSASVTFDYATACEGTRPPGHVTRFFKVIEEVAFGVPATGAPQPPVPVEWDPAVTADPGVVVHQPDRDPVVLTSPGAGSDCDHDRQRPCRCRDRRCKSPQTAGRCCTEQADDLLRCLGLPDTCAGTVTVTSVSLRVDLDDHGPAKGCAHHPEQAPRRGPDHDPGKGCTRCHR